MLIDTPRFKCLVLNEYLTGGAELQGFTEAYCFAFTLLESRPLLATVHTIDGAVFSRLPLKALRHFESEATELNLDPWGAISGDGHAICHAYLKDYLIEVSFADQIISGMYLFTIDYFSGGFSQDPEQHKTSNVILLENGHICAMPNNRCLFKDLHFTDEREPLNYRRTRAYHTLSITL